MCVVWVTGLKNLGRVGKQVFFLITFFSGKKTCFWCILKGKFAFQNASKLYFFQKIGKKIYVSLVNLGRVGLP